ncbi:MAG: GNAT family N-acetyltransferase [Planctomycetota bacterium]
MKHVELEGGRSIVIHEMTRDEIMPGGGGRCPINCKMDLAGDLEPTEHFRLLNEALIDAYGATTILALDGTAVAGFTNFFPTWCPQFQLCNDDQIDRAMARLQDIRRPPESDDPALHVRCLMVRPEYRGHGLALELLDYLKRWARDHGWKKLVANGCVFSGLAQYQWRVAPKPPRPLWEKAGFRVEDFVPLNLNAVSDEADAREDFEWFKQWSKSEEYPKDLPRDVADDEPGWREVFTQYTMVCAL